MIVSERADQPTRELAGCFNPPGAEARKKEADRLAAALASIPNHEDFPWKLHKSDFPGMTLKHVVDEIFNWEPVVQQDGSTHRSYFSQFHTDATNFNIKTKTVAPWPKEWADWDTPTFPAQSLVQLQIDCEHCIAEPVPMQPQRTQEKIEYWIHLVSPEKVVILQRSTGSGYTFCDRMNPEQLIVLTQSGASLDDVSVHYEVTGRLTVKKSLMLLDSVIRQQMEKQTRDSYKGTFANIVKPLKALFERRISHTHDESDPISEMQGTIEDLQMQADAHQRNTKVLFTELQSVINRQGQIIQALSALIVVLLLLVWATKWVAQPPCQQFLPEVYSWVSPLLDLADSSEQAGPLHPDLL